MYQAVMSDLKPVQKSTDNSHYYRKNKPPHVWVVQQDCDQIESAIAIHKDNRSGQDPSTSLRILLALLYKSLHARSSLLCR